MFLRQVTMIIEFGRDQVFNQKRILIGDRIRWVLLQCILYSDIALKRIEGAEIHFILRMQIYSQKCQRHVITNMT